MTFELVLFYFFAAILIGSAACVITVRSTIHATLFLVLTFFTSAIIWVMMQAEFLGIVLVLVYVGAVMVLFLFVVMMLDINVAKMRAGFVRFLPLGLIVAVIMAVELVMVVSGRYFDAMPVDRLSADHSNTRALGEVLYTEYVFQFEIAAAILLVAIVAAIALTMRRREGSKYIDPAEQVVVRREDRVRLVSMKAEERK